MRRWWLGALLAAIAAGLGGGGAIAQGPKPYLTDPALSPDGAEIAFASGGDIWTVPAGGGSAQLLITDPATDSRPLYSPDGKELAFLSTRGGSTNLHVLTLATGQIRRITWSDANEQLDGWSRDGKWLYFSSAATDVRGQMDVMRVPASGGTPLEVSRERYLNEFHAAPSPDGKSIALMAKGRSNVDWWRNGHSHIDEAELWLKPVDGGAYRRLLPPTSKRLWPMWAPDSAALYFMSDESGAENLWRMPVAAGSKPTQVTRFGKGRVLWPTIAYDGSAIVFERDLAIWKHDVRTGQSAKVAITLRGAPAAAGDRRLNETTFRSMALSPDGKKAALIAHGEVFAVSTKDGGAAQRITETSAAERDLTWSPDSRRLAYASERGLASNLVEYDFNTGKERALTSGPGFDGGAVYSPDGKMLAYAHGPRELRVITLSDKPVDKLIYTGALDRTDGFSRFTWSPDSQWIAFAVTDAKSFRNVNVIPAAGGTARPISFLANGNAAERIAWSGDGKFIVFDTAQRSEEPRLVRVDLVPHVPRYREDAFKELFGPREPAEKKDPAPPATPTEPAGAPAEKAPPKPAAVADDAKPKTPKPLPVNIVFEGIRERATFIPLGIPADTPIISPDSKTLVFTATFNGQENLYSYNLDELAKEPPTPVQLTSTRRGKRDYVFTSDSKELYYLDGGALYTTPVETPRAKAIAVNAEMEVKFDQEKAVVFNQAWSLLDRNFYDAKFHGQDWTALHATYAPYVAGARTGDELRRIMNLMIGELNASHTGMGRPTEGFGSAPPARVGDLGLRYERGAFEAGKGLLIREVVSLGPADLSGVKVGETLLAVGGKPVGPATNLDALLLDRTGKQVILTIGSAADASKTREVTVRPVSAAVSAGLAYRQWVNGRRAYVEQISGGKLGYVHIVDMSAESLNQLYIDLDAQNQGKAGVVIDLRNNNGGFVNGYVLDVFSRKNFLTMTPRDLFGVPSRQGLGQRALGSPTVLLINESSLSDAEDFTEGYRSLGLGKVVGVPTAGWIIYTSNIPLIDGSQVRVPSVKIQDMRGENMELNPRKVDVTVERPLGETLTGKDAQLEAAVAELLKGI